MDNKPIGATPEQLEEHGIEWVIGDGYNVGLRKYPQKWLLRDKREHKWEQEKVRLLQEIANLRRKYIK